MAAKSTEDPLARYWSRRDFSVTSETRGERAKPGKALSFVIQKHAASRLHYDSRLELDGVLLSWAVPKGPSFDPMDKRMAIHVEDHPPFLWHLRRRHSAEAVRRRHGKTSFWDVRHPHVTRPLNAGCLRVDHAADELSHPPETIVHMGSFMPDYPDLESLDWKRRLDAQQLLIVTVHKATWNQGYAV